MRRISLGLALLAVALAVACAASPGGDTYVVRPGDTLSGIAADHSTTADELVRLNEGTYPSLRDDPGLIRVGWTLTLPGQGRSQGEANPDVIAPRGATAAGPTEEQLWQVEQAIIRLTNEARREQGLQDLEVDALLMEIARERAAQLPAHYSHYGPHGEPLCREVASRRGYAHPQGLAENIASHARAFLADSEDLFYTLGWLSSAGHRANILHPDLRHLGVGVFCAGTTCYGVQVFGP